jgi:hypothetical protein
LRPENGGVPLQSKSTSPGIEGSLRRYILSLEQGHPNYEEMSPQLAAAVNQQLPKNMATIGGLGEFERKLGFSGTESQHLMQI